MKIVISRMLVAVSFVAICINGYSQAKSKATINDYKTISHIMQEGIEQAFDNKTALANEAFEKAYLIAKSKNYDELIPVIIIAQSRLLALTNDYEKGLEKLTLAEPYLNNIVKNSLYGDFYEFKAQCYVHQKKYAEALESLKLCEKSRNEIEPAKNWRTYNGYARVYNRTNQPELAEEYSQKADKLAKIQNSKKILQDLQTELQFNEKDGTILILSSENKKSQLELKKTQFQRKLFLFGLLTFLVLSTFLYVIIKQRNKINKEITKRNELITKNLEEKEYLIKEIHHRVKNNLQVISSLLSLQSRSVEDENAIQALKESQGRVHSMTLIHQNLYKDGPTSHLDIKEYLSNLSQTLINTYSVTDKPIALKLDLPSVMVDVGKLVPIGLIINELITNSIKYAFQTTKNAELSVMGKFENNNLTLVIGDNGSGYDFHSNMGFGTKLINIFAKKLNASIVKTEDNGTHVELIIPNISTEVNE